MSALLDDAGLLVQRVTWHIIRQATVRALVITAVAVCVCLKGNAAVAQGGAEWLTLRVALYPAVPQRQALFTQLEQQFERMYPGVNIELVETYEDGGRTKSLVDGYYSGGLAKAKADIYEIDTILLTDLVDGSKIQPLELPFNDFATTAVDAVTRNGKIYAVPHWMCGNFLFYDKSDADVVSAVEQATNWSTLVSNLKAHNKKLFVDLFGRSTLGEWYLTAYSDIVGLPQAQIDVETSLQPDLRVVNALSELISVCSNGLCRNADLHSRAGYYARAFVRKEGQVYVGYSETIHYGLQDAIENCLGQCLTKDTIGIRSLPAFFEPRKGNGVGWVDGLGIDASVHGPKRALAEEFVRFVVSDSGYRLVLEPEGDGSGDAPRYLLPSARKPSHCERTSLPNLSGSASGPRNRHPFGPQQCSEAHGTRTEFGSADTPIDQAVRPDAKKGSRNELSTTYIFGQASAAGRRSCITWDHHTFRTGFRLELSEQLAQLLHNTCRRTG